MTDLAGVVLCGGRGRRMGTDKALLSVEGRPLVLRVAELVSRAADPVFLAPGEVGRLGRLDYPEVADAAPNAGPLAGLVAALRASPRLLLAVVAVDMPFASPGVLRLLAELHAGEDAVVPITASGPEPLHAVYSKECLPSLEEALARGRLGLRGLLEGLEVREVRQPELGRADPSGRFALNLNRAEDLALLP